MKTDDKRCQIMHAAEALFTSRRFHEITLDEVAAAAHVGKGTIYRYFKDKDDLFFQTATSGFDELCHLVREAVPREDSFEENLLAVCGLIASFFQRRRELFRMMQDHEARMRWCDKDMRKRWGERREELLEAVASVFEKEVRQGRISSRIGPKALAMLLLGMLRARARDFDARPNETPALSSVVDLMVHGIGASRQGDGTTGG